MDLLIMIVVNIANIASVWYAAKNDRCTWSIGFVAMTAAATLFFMSGHYMSFTFHTYCAIVYIFGYIRWKDSTAENDKRICWGSPYMPLIIIALLSVGIYIFNQVLSNNPWLDSIGTAMSIVAAYLLVKHDINSWLLYLLSDVIYIYLGIISNNIEYVIIYVIMIILGIYGTREFIIKYRLNKNE